MTLAACFALALAFPADIYGEDDRYEPFEIGGSGIEELARAVAVLIPAEWITMAGELRPGTPSFGQTQQRVLDEETGQERLVPVGREERFFDQPAYGRCSGFLVAPDLLVTAGHCVTENGECKDSFWVFGYEVDPATGQVPAVLGADNVYRCAEIITTSHRGRAGDADASRHDYALVRLDREVVGRTPLVYRTSGRVPNDADLALFGYPSGMPLKVTLDGKVRENDDELWFSTTLDSFGGNSGSPVIDLRTGLVEGILVRGMRYHWSEDLLSGRARVIHFDEESGGLGTHVERITNVPELFDGFTGGKLLLDAVAAGRVDDAHALLEGNARVEGMKDSLGRGALHLAMISRSRAMADLVLAAGASRTARDDGGNTPLHYAALHGFPEGVEALLEGRVAINATNHRGATPYFYAQEVTCRLGGESSEHAAVLELLRARGARTDLAPVEGPDTNALLEAIRSGDEEDVVELLALRSVDPNAGGLPLMWATHLGHRGIVALLLADERVDVNAAVDGRNAWFYARVFGWDGIRQDLDAAGAHPHAPAWMEWVDGHDDQVATLGSKLLTCTYVYSTSESGVLELRNVKDPDDFFLYYDQSARLDLYAPCIKDVGWDGGTIEFYTPKVTRRTRTIYDRVVKEMSATTEFVFWKLDPIKQWEGIGVLRELISLGEPLRTAPPSSLPRQEDPALAEALASVGPPQDPAAPSEASADAETARL